MSKKGLLAALALLFSLGVLLGTLAFVSFDASGLAGVVLGRARDATGLTLAASRARFHLFDGLVLDDVRAATSFGAGGYEARLPRLVFEHRPLALLRGRLELTRVVIERPRVVVNLGMAATARAPATRVAGVPASPESRSSSADPAPPAGPLLTVELAPVELRLEGGDFVVSDRRENQERLSLDGLHLTLGELAFHRRSVTLLHALTARGAVAVGELGVEGLRLRNVEAGLTTENGHLRLADLRFTRDEGDFRGELEIDFNSIPFRYRLSLTGPSVAIEGVGRGALRLEGEGFGTGSKNLTGGGTLELGPGTVPDSPWIRKLHADLPGASRSPAAIAFRVQDDRLEVAAFRIEAPPLEVELSGSVVLRGAVDLFVTLREEGRESAYRLTGTVEAPELNRRRD